jgi:hypothetical protein
VKESRLLKNKFKGILSNDGRVRLCQLLIGHCHESLGAFQHCLQSVHLLLELVRPLELLRVEILGTVERTEVVSSVFIAEDDIHP